MEKTYNMMDAVKYFSAILLVCAHTASERVNLPSLLEMFCSLYIVTVPFFFVTSSFLFFRKLEHRDCSTPNPSLPSFAIYKRWSKRIGLMYLIWSLIYFCFVVTTWIQNDASFDEIMQWAHQSLVFSTYSTIWFLPALWIAVSLVYFLRYKLKCSLRTIIAISAFFYLIGALEYSYHSINPILDVINDGYKSVMKTWRNGFFNGFVFASLGLIIANTEMLKKKISLIGTVVFGAAFLAEAFIMKKIVPTSDANFLLMLVPFIYFFFNLVCTTNLPDSKIYLPLRKMSTLIFLSQRIFLTAIPSVLGAECMVNAWTISDNGIVALALVVLEVCVFSFILMMAARKIKVLKYLM